MALTKLDIQKEGFEHSLRGYDVEQVDVFLERVANEVDAMNNRIAELEEQLESTNKELESANEQIKEAADKNAAEPSELEQASLREQEMKAELEVAKERAEAEARRAQELESTIGQLKEQLEEKSKLDNTIAEAFIAAQRSAEQIKEEARAEADRIREESEAKAQEYIRESLDNKSAIVKEVHALHRSAHSFRDEYLAMLDRFMAQAKDAFKDLPDLSDLEEQIGDAIAKAAAEEPAVEESAVVEASDAEASEDLPRLTTEQIPKIDIPSIIPDVDED